MKRQNHCRFWEDAFQERLDEASSEATADEAD